MAKKTYRTPCLTKDITHDGVRNTLCNSIDREEHLQNQCFWFFEGFKWAALVTGLVSTLLVALWGGRPGAQWLAVFPALTAFFVSMEPTFQFKARSGWHYDNRIAWSGLLAQLDAGADLNEIRVQMVKVEKDQGSRFPHGSVPTTR